MMKNEEGVIKLDLRPLRRLSASFRHAVARIDTTELLFGAQNSRPGTRLHSGTVTLFTALPPRVTIM